MEQLNDNRCSLPFTDMFNINLNTMTVTPCCKIPVSPICEVNGIYNKTVLEVRQAIKDNVRSDHCKKCWDMVDSGGISRRSQYSIHNAIDWDKVDIYDPVEHIQIKFSNTCQLQCVYCGPWSSSTWANNAERFTSHQRSAQDIKSLVVNYKNIESLIDLAKLKTIQVSGGEPMLDDECVDFLMNLPFDEKRNLSIITNLSYGSAVLNKLLKIIKIHQNIKIYISLDAVGENPSRKFLNWNLWFSNFNILLNELQDRIKIYPSALLNIKPTANVLNYKEIPEIINFILDYKKNGYNGLTFRIGTPFKNELSSLWSANIDKSVKINISDSDLKYFDHTELLQIKLFNEMILNCEYDINLGEKTKKYINLYLNDE